MSAVGGPERMALRIKVLRVVTELPNGARVQRKEVLQQYDGQQWRDVPEEEEVIRLDEVHGGGV